MVVDTPAVTPLSIPELLEPTVDGEGVAHYDLKVGASRHDYQQPALTDTYSYNGMSVLGPTLLLRTGDSVIAARFDSYAAEDIPYMFHCHILDHEDLGMMGQFLVIDE